ncbi:Hypothetical protein POVN_LOCUS386 [uncultured virus]|nr:Hypothetical protein POVN_LOCUS386 [uncultured virus]
MTEVKAFTPSEDELKALTTLRDLVKRLDALVEGGTPSLDAAALYEWLDKDGLHSLKVGLLDLVDNYEPILDAATEKCLAEALDGWTPGFSVDEGRKLYELSKPGEPSTRLLKVEGEPNREDIRMGMNPATEAAYAELAARIGVGPTIYGSAICPDKNGARKYYTVMQRLAGPTLAEAKGVKIADLIAAVTLYYRLLTEAGVEQHDFHTGNVMFDGNRLYIIDYGMAGQITAEEARDPQTISNKVRKAAAILIDSTLPVYLNVEKNEREVTERWLEANYEVEALLAKLLPDISSGPLVHTVPASWRPHLSLLTTLTGVSERLHFAE